MTACQQAAGPVLAGPVLAGPVLAGPVLAGPVLAGPVLAGPVLAGWCGLAEPGDSLLTAYIAQPAETLST